MADVERMQDTAARIQAIADRFAASPDTPVRERVQELVRLLMELYGGGLERIVQILERELGPDAPLLAALARDELISSLLVLHDLHPDDAATRIRRELERIRPIAGVEASLVALAEDGVVHVRLGGERSARTPGAAELQRLVDEVVRSAAPDVVRVEIEGLQEHATVPLVQLTSRGRSPRVEGAGRA